MASPATPHRSTTISERAFTLIELIVVMALMVLLTSIILANNNQFGGALTLRILAYQVALSVREAQTYGISVKKFGDNSFQSGFGVHFDRSSPSSYVLFGDGLSKNGLYDQGELVEAITLSRNFAISDLCAASGSAASETCGLNTVDILFRRPEPDAQILINSEGIAFERARVILSSPRGDRLSVVVEAAGQIAVSPAP